MTFACNESVEIHGEINDYCGIVAFPEGLFTSTGLRYNGNSYKLKFGFSDSTSNQLAEPVAYVQIEGEALIIHPGQLKAQRVSQQLS